MSWDSKALAIMAVTWIAFGVVYGVLVQMPAGARGWTAGGVILIALLAMLWRTERRTEAAATPAPVAKQAVAAGETD